MGLPFTNLDERAVKAIDELEVAARQAQVTLAAAHEFIANLNKGLEDALAVLAKLKAALT